MITKTMSTKHSVEPGLTKKTVLIPVEQADFSLQILPYVERFLNPTENRLILLHVEKEPDVVHIDRPGFTDLDIYVDQSEAAWRTNFLDDLLPTVRALEKLGFEVQTDVQFGTPVHELEYYIKHRQVDLVAMTTHGRSPLGRVIFGSVAEHILHDINVPILLFHPADKTSQ
ncbi:MAG: universal stress protein [Caldilineaceae bacterium]